MTPVEIDTELARLWGEEQQLDVRLHRAMTRLADREKSTTRYYASTVEDDEAEIANLQNSIAALQAEAQPLVDEFFARGRWNRYFLVSNDNGHVHRGTNCSTCFVTTQYSWLVELADCDEDAMIEEWGERACTVCFPSAPTNPLYHRPARIDREAQAARQAEKAQRDAAKATKAIVDVDGQPLRGEYGVIKTKVAARNELSGAIKSLAWYGPGHPTDFAAVARKMAAALRASAPEIDVDKVIANAIKAAAKDGATYTGQIETLLAGEVPLEAIEDSVDTRLQPALEALGATVKVVKSTYATSLTVTFPINALDAANTVRGAALEEPDAGLSTMLMELARRFHRQVVR